MSSIVTRPMGGGNEFVAAASISDGQRRRAVLLQGTVTNARSGPSGRQNAQAELPSDAGNEPPVHDDHGMAAAGLMRAIITVGAVLAALFVVASTCVWSWRGAHPLPYCDAWAFVDDFAHWHDGTYGWHELLRPANEHRIVLPRLLFFADYLWFGASEKALVVAALVMLSALSCLIVRLATASSAHPLSARVAIAGVVVATLFSGTQLPCLGWGFAVQFMAHSLLPAAACALILRPAPRARHLALALACAVGATLSIASSLLLWPVLFLIAGARRLGWPTLVSIAATGAACWWLYLHERSPISRPAVSLANTMMQSIGWSLTHLGSAWQTDVWASLVLGTVGWILLLAAFVRLCHRRDHRALTLFTIAALWSLYSLAIGYGRHDLGRDEALAGRYAPGPLLFWAALLAGHLRLAASTARRFLAIAATVLVGLLVYKQTKSSKRWLNVREERAIATLAIWLGDFDRTRYAEIGAIHADFAAAVAVLRTHQVSIFASPVAELPQQRLEPRFHVDQSAASLAFARLPDQPARASTALRFVAGTLPAQARQFGDTLAAVDVADRVCGLGSLGWDVPRAQRALVTAGAERWFALVPAEQDPTQLRWFVLDVEHGRALALPRLPLPP